jgi:hypothetical protein
MMELLIVVGTLAGVVTGAFGTFLLLRRQTVVIGKVTDCALDAWRESRSQVSEFASRIQAGTDLGLVARTETTLRGEGKSVVVHEDLPEG